MRRPRVERIVAWAARMNSNKAPGPMVRALRDLLLPLILKRQGSADSQRWVYDHHIEWDARSGSAKRHERRLLAISY